jgi:hypothetical protein
MSRLRRSFAEEYEIDLDTLVNEASTGGDVCFGNDWYGDPGSEFWRNIEIVSGLEISERQRENTSFRCAC